MLSRVATQLACLDRWNIVTRVIHRHFVRLLGAGSQSWRPFQRNAFSELMIKGTTHGTKSLTDETDDEENDCTALHDSHD